MLALEEAVECLLHHTRSITETERIPLLTSTNRILAAPLSAMADQPPFPRSPLDGYAVRGQDTEGAKKDFPKRLKVIGAVYAGEVFCGTVKEAVADSPYDKFEDAYLWYSDEEVNDDENI